eukprot:gnl/MRDRNA2_/MRDRNA2_29409_c0_seq1.p1 gnl/MRDRNA2_/MRDRNA2_29409_c0~~gnl/MRDRNA2_/MRDRNA2_29409_c0_seq1.p1  ORF type:complete len:754 (-),score=230.61 gnl/MRDRNA2_/MRDRNA2_29409_c0_seq1:6-2171(-)
MTAYASFIFIVLVIGSTSMAAGVEDTSNAAIQKVIQMLQDMVATAKKEKHEEEVKYAEFATFCTSETADLKNEIASAAEQIDLLTSEIEKLGSDVAGLAQDIAQLSSDVASMEADAKTQTAQREKENAIYLGESQDYAETLDALDRAIMVLSKQNYDRKQAHVALMQLSDKNGVPERVQAMVSAFMAMMDADDASQAPTPPEANAYEFQSGGIVDMLKRLQDDFRKQAKQCDKEEMNSKHAYDMVMQDLTDSISRAKEDIESKSAEKEQKITKIAEDKGLLAATMKDKAEDEKTLSDLTAECHQKGLSFKEKQQLRAEEIDALLQAIKILSSEAIAGGAQHLSLAAQKVGQGSTLVQLRASKANGASSAEGIRHKITEFLDAKAKSLKSKQLALLADKIAADPFAKVKKLIDDMITRLLEEANADAEQEGFCDKELGTNKITRDKLTAEIDELQAAIEEGQSLIMKLTTDIAQLNKEVAELDAAIAESTKLREEEKAKNTATIADSKAAQEAVSAAMAVLKEFYAKAGQATALVQIASVTQPLKTNMIQRPKMGSEEWKALANPNYEGTVDKGHKAGMQTFGETYTGQQDEAGGVLAMLDVIMSDFANLESDTMANEAAAQKTYDDFMIDANKNKAVKTKNIEMFTADKVAAESKLNTDTKDVKATQDELLAADRYYEKLKPQCIDAGVSYEDRVKAREAEIASLKEALAILSSEGPATSS